MPRERVSIDRSAQMRYAGQSYEVTTPVPSGALDAEALSQLVHVFNGVHEREYGVASDSFPVSFVTLRVTGIGWTDKPSRADLTTRPPATNGDRASVKAQRPVYFSGSYHDSEVHDVALLGHHQQVLGPAIIEQVDGVIVLPPGSVGRSDRYGNVKIDVTEATR